MSKSQTALHITPGISEFVSIGTGVIRGGIESAGRVFFVSGNEFYEIDISGTATKRGELNTVSGYCFLEENPTQVMITDGEYGYIFNRTTNAFNQITDVDFPTPSSLSFQDGYFMVSIADSSLWAISGLNNGLTWDAADRTTVENSPDNLVCVVSDSSNVWAFGTKSVEVYQNTGATAFPFQVINGAFIETGCAAAATIQKINNTFVWLGTDENGDSVVWRAEGYNAVRVSTKPIERKISESSDFTGSYAWVYHERGHAFYCLQVKGLKTTLVLDLATMLWHERVYRNTSTNVEEQHRGSCHVFFKQMHLVGDRENNKIYKMSLDTYSDDGDPILRDRISPHYDEEKALITHAQFELDMEVGNGLVTGQGSDPQIMMRYSDDGGHTWSNELWRSLGKLGEYRTRVKWNKLGMSRDRVYQIRVSDPVFLQINEAYLNGR